LARGLGLGDADRIAAMHDLALQVGKVDSVAVANGQRADACGREIKRDR
jgi:hypothetical protein